MTLQDIKDSIALDIKSNGEGKITGDILKEKLFQMVDGIGTFTYLKHSSMSPTGNIGLATMVDVFILNNNPQSIADFEVTAKISNTTPGTPGQKGRVEFMMPKQPYIEPKQQEDKITFNRKPQDTDQFNISGVGSGYNIAFTNVNDNANEINVSNKSFKEVIDSIILKLQSGQNYANAATIVETQYGFTNQLNTAGSKFSGTGINDLRIYATFSTTQEESNIEIEVIANGFDIFEFNGVGGIIQNGSDIVGDSSGAIATALYTTDMGGGLYWTRVKVISGTFTLFENVTIDGNFSAIYNTTVSSSINDLLKVSNQVFNQPLDISYIVMSGNSSQNINDVQFYFDVTDTGHTVGDKWMIETKYGAVKLELNSTAIFNIGEQIQGQTSGAIGIVVGHNTQFATTILIVKEIYGGFSVGENIVGLTSLVSSAIFNYESDRYFGDVYFRARWDYNGSQQSSYYTPTTFDATVDTFNIQNEITVTSVDDYNLASEINQFCDNQTQIFSVKTWYNSGPIIAYYDVFKNTSNPNGTLGPFDIKYFTNAAEMESAIEWALTNTGNFNNIFDLISITDVNSNQIKILAETIEIPNNPNDNDLQVNIGQTGQNVFYSYITSQITQQTIATILEAVRNTIIGVIVDETPTHVIIKDGLIHNIKLASQVDGEFGCLPYTKEMQNEYNFLVAWRNGTFISYYGLYSYFQSLNIQLGDQYLFDVGRIRGVYNPLDKALPGEMVLAAREFAGQK